MTPSSPAAAHIRLPSTLQAALLYTASDGSRRIRVSTRRLGVAHSFDRLASSVHPPALLGLTTKLVCAKLASTSMKEVAEELEKSCVDSLVSQVGSAVCCEP